MISTKEALARMEEVVAMYLEELEKLSMEQLLHKPNEEDWSIGQMYMHLIGSAQYMHLGHVQRCLDAAEGSVDEGETTEEAKAVFEQGSFPPIRIRVPASPQYTPAQPADKEQLREGLQGVLQRMRELEPAVAQTESRATMPHPRYGSLNAKQWYVFVEMHYRHHLGQLERLKGLPLQG